MDINNNLKQYRSEYDLTQEDLAKSVGVTRQTINSIERGRYNPSLELAFKLSHRFECSIEDIFQSDSPTNQSSLDN